MTSVTSSSGLVNGLANMAVSTGYGPQFLRFNGQACFKTFSIRFKAHLNTVKQGLGKVIDDTAAAPSAEDDSMAYDLLVNALDDQTITIIVAHAPSCRAAWKTLQESCIGSKLDVQRKCLLDLCDLKMHREETPALYCARIRTLWSAVKEDNKTVDNTFIIEASEDSQNT